MLQGCVADPEAVATAKARGAAAFGLQQYHAALQHYSDALAALDEGGSVPKDRNTSSTAGAGSSMGSGGDHARGTDERLGAGAAEASRLHTNRALCLLKLSPPHAAGAESEAAAAIAADPTSHKVCACNAWCALLPSNRDLECIQSSCP